MCHIRFGQLHLTGRSEIDRLAENLHRPTNRRGHFGIQSGAALQCKRACCTLCAEGKRPPSLTLHSVRNRMQSLNRFRFQGRGFGLSPNWLQEFFRRYTFLSLVALSVVAGMMFGATVAYQASMTEEAQEVAGLANYRPNLVTRVICRRRQDSGGRVLTRAPNSSHLRSDSRHNEERRSSPSKTIDSFNISA